MALNITSNEIQILNSAGQVKFTNTQPLLFVAGYESGTYAHENYSFTANGASYNIYSGTVAFNLQTPIATNEVPVVYITITSASGWGGPATSLVGVRQPANAVLPIYVRGFPNGNTPASDTTQMALTPGFNSAGEITTYTSTLMYYQNGGGTLPAVFSGSQQGLSNPTLNITWEIYKYRYLED